MLDLSVESRVFSNRVTASGQKAEAPFLAEQLQRATGLST